MDRYYHRSILNVIVWSQYYVVSLLQWSHAIHYASRPCNAKFINISLRNPYSPSSIVIKFPNQTNSFISRMNELIFSKFFPPKLSLTWEISVFPLSRACDTLYTRDILCNKRRKEGLHSSSSSVILTFPALKEILDVSRSSM